MEPYVSRISRIARKSMDIGGYLPGIGIPIIGYRLIDTRLDPDRCMSKKQLRAQILYVGLATLIVIPAAPIM